MTSFSRSEHSKPSIQLFDGIGFYFRFGYFQFREQFSDIGSGLVGYILFPFFMFVLGKMWEKFNSSQGNFHLEQVMGYVAVTEVYFMTFLRPAVFSRATSDFSIALARPRSWLGMYFSNIFARTLSARILLTLTFVIAGPLLGIPLAQVMQQTLSILMFLVPLTIWSSLFSLIFASAQVFWPKTQYFTLPVSKVFLALGGVFGPLNDYSEPWKSFLLKLPSSDLFFQVGYFSIHQSFFKMTDFEWISRVFLQILGLLVINIYFFKMAKRAHQSYGG